MTEENTVSLKADTYVCPRCNNETQIDYIKITIKEYEGYYCLKCYAQWISENFPKLEVKKESTL